MSVPDNLAELIDEVKKQATNPAQIPLPVDPSQPPLKMPKTVDIKDLPEQDRKRLQQAIQAATQQAASQKELEDSLPAQAGEGVAEAIRAARGEARKLEIEDDVSQAAPAKKPVAEPVRKTATASPAAEPSQPAATDEEFMAQGDTKSCPNCSWDLENRDVEEITERDKQNFLAATLGNKPFQKLFSLFDNQLQITLRSLRFNEVDACYRQCYEDRRQDELATAADFMEQLNRYRLCLQLVEIRSGSELIQFPESLAGWNGYNDYRDLPSIFDKVSEEALQSESLRRLATKCLFKFNRIMSRLEANCDNENFWKAVDTTS
jgi:hypothetical protein